MTSGFKNECKNKILFKKTATDPIPNCVIKFKALANLKIRPTSGSNSQLNN